MTLYVALADICAQRGSCAYAVAAGRGMSPLVDRQLIRLIHCTEDEAKAMSDAIDGTVRIPAVEECSGTMLGTHRSVQANWVAASPRAGTWSGVARTGTIL